MRDGSSPLAAKRSLLPMLARGQPWAETRGRSPISKERMEGAMIQVVSSLKMGPGRVGLQSGPMRKGEQRRVSTLVASTRPFIFHLCTGGEYLEACTSNSHMHVGVSRYLVGLRRRYYTNLTSFIGRPENLHYSVTIQGHSGSPCM